MTTVVDDKRRAKEAEFVDFFENAPIALHWLSDTGHVLWANKTEMSVLGYTPQEYIGQNIMQDTLTLTVTLTLTLSSTHAVLP